MFKRDKKVGEIIFLDGKRIYKDSYKKLLEHFENMFPAWGKCPNTGILNAFFEDDLDKLVKNGYLDRNEYVTFIDPKKRKKQIKVKNYRLGVKGFTELAELRNKQKNNITIVISAIALIVSILTFIFTFFIAR
jgi:hypothetical protein